MKTYLLTEEDVERLREEFCISVMKSKRLDDMISGWGWFSTNDHARMVIECKDPDFSKTQLTAQKEGEGISQQISKGICTEYKGGKITAEDIIKLTEWYSGTKSAKRNKN